MTLFQAIVLGIIQGLSEFLPISSSAHLALAPWLFGWRDPGLAFDVALHFGTLLAVLWYFRHEWIALIGAAIRIVRQRRLETDEDRRVVYLILATIPGAIAGKLLESQAETAFRSPALVASALIVMGIILWVVDLRARQDRELGSMRWKDALIIGIAQMFAIIPGVSRSGSTMTAGRALGFTRQSAAVFSFLMSMPIIAAAATLKLPDAIHQYGITTPFVVGVVSSALSGWLAIAVLLRFVTRNSFGVFAVYRLILGAVVLLVVALRG